MFRDLLPIVLLMTASPVIAGSATKTAKLEGMAYDKARTVVLGYGWKPFRRGCGGLANESTCARYPEVGYCQGTGRGFCGMTFTKESRCLYLTTVESPPGQGGYTVIYDVRFSRGLCQKDPS